MVTELKSENINKLHLFINEYLDFELFHYSHKQSPHYQKHEDSVGEAILTLACFTKTAFIHKVSESRLTETARHLLTAFKELIFAEFVKSKVYQRVNYGANTTSAEINSENFILTAFRILLSRAFKHNFQKLFLMLMDTVPSEIKNDDYKTTLQQFLQSKSRPLPKYSTKAVSDDLRDLVFGTSLYVDNHEFTGFASSKKAAEKGAAYSACVYYKIVPKDTKLSTYKFNLSDLYKNTIKHKNSKVCDAFGIPADNNIIQAFVPQRHKRTMGHNGDCQRRLASVGPVYLNYLRAKTVLTAAKEGSLGSDNLLLASRMLSTSSLAAILETGLISKSDVLFLSDIDDLGINYEVDCIQALFAMRFLEFLYNPLSTYSETSEAENWFINVINDRLSDETKVKKSITSIVTERCGSLGFTFRFIKNNSSWGVELVHQKTNKIYNVFHIRGKTLELKKDVFLALSKLILESLDRLEGYYFSDFKSESSMKAQNSLIQYLFYSITDTYKPVQAISNLMLATSNSQDYSNYSKGELLEIWEADTLDIHSRAHILFFLHKKTNVIIEDVSVADYYFLPAVFEKFFDLESFSITDIFSNEDSITDSLVDDHNLTEGRLEKKTHSKISVISTENKPKLQNENKFSKPSEIVSYKDGLDLNNFKELEGVDEDIEKYKELYKNMTLEDLETIWSNRFRKFDYKEQSAVVLSLIRFHRGIDTTIDYRRLLLTDIITELDLPSIYDDKKTADHIKKEKIEKKTNVIGIKKSLFVSSNIEVDGFVPDSIDTRSFIKTKIANRSGQSSFRARLIKKCKSCNITGCTTISALDAAHIAPYRGEKDNDIRNGLLLRADIHRLFDAYLIGINPQSLTVHISPKIDDPIYTQYEGKKINIEGNKDISLAAIEYHWIYYTNNID